VNLTLVDLKDFYSMSILGLVCLTLIAMAAVSGLALAFYASLPNALLIQANLGRYAGLTASEPSAARSSDNRGVRIGPLQDHSA
jgi:hypothetical protein